MKRLTVGQSAGCVVVCLVSMGLLGGCGSSSSGGSGGGAGGGSAGGTGGGSGGGSGGGTGGGYVPPAGMVHLTGAVAKGPLVLGSEVDVSPVDATGNPLGAVFQTMTTTDDGRFGLDLPPVGLAQLKGRGYYYNEISGALSASDLTLYSLGTVSDAGTQISQINLVTHLTFLRVKTLLGQGKTLSEASTQAESELRTALKIGGTAFDPGASGSQMSFLGGDTNSSAYLFALASSFVRMAMIKGGGSVESVLQERVNTLESTFAASGTVDAASLDLINRAQSCVRPSDAVDKLTKRFLAISSTATVPNIDRALDSDLDGVPNLTDTCLRIANPTQAAVTDQVCSSSIDVGAGATTALMSVQMLRAADLNADGKLDVVALGTGNNGASLTSQVVVWVAQADGGFAAPTAISLSSKLVTTASVTVYQARLGDVSGDGKADLVLSYSLANPMNQPGFPQLGYLPGDGSGGFGNFVPIVALSDPNLCGSAYCQMNQLCSAGVCVGDCRLANPCPMGTSSCDQASGLCKCGSGAACGGGQYCLNGACGSTMPCNAASCTGGTQCNNVSGACECGGAVCGSNTTCQAGVCTANCPSTPCSAAQTCVGGNSCQVSCGASTCMQGTQQCDYGTLSCVTTCTGAGQCLGGMVCVNGACVMGCTGGAPCVAGKTCTFNGCQSNCGGGGPCSMGQVCITGLCQPDCRMMGCMNNIGTCNPSTGQCACGAGPACSTGQACVSGVCAATCGASMQACRTGETCFNGQCRCGSASSCQMNQTCQASGCAPNCGAGGPCGANQSCQGGTCGPAPFPGVLDFELKDVNGDTRLDLVGTVWGAEYSPTNGWSYPAQRVARIAVLLGQAGGGFGAPTMTPVSSTASTDAVELQLGDLDGATGTDLVVSVRLTSSTSMAEAWTALAVLNNGSGAFAPVATPSPTLSGPFSGRVNIRLGDLDGDGKRDLTILEGLAPTFPMMTYVPAVKLLFGDGAGHFGSVLPVAVPSAVVGVPYGYADCADARPVALSYSAQDGEVGVADLNGDGRADLFTADAVFLSGVRSIGAAGRLEGRGPSLSGSATNKAPGSLTVPNTTGPLSIDLDGDGKSEVLDVSILQTGTSSPVFTGTLRVGRINPANTHSW